MADFINRETVVKLLRGELVSKYPMTFYMGLLAAADEISKISAADVVEVVRCKECRHWKGDLCGNSDEDFSIWSGDDFCSYGERG